MRSTAVPTGAAESIVQVSINFFSSLTPRPEARGVPLPASYILGRNVLGGRMYLDLYSVACTKIGLRSCKLRFSLGRKLRL
jgi:hypothetical protein